jgi:hypothetical protein
VNDQNLFLINHEFLRWYKLYDKEFVYPKYAIKNNALAGARQWQIYCQTSNLELSPKSKTKFYCHLALSLKIVAHPSD